MLCSSPRIAVFPLLATLGCASPGPPRPPSLHLPENARALAAERVGDAVHLTWTSPLNTTDGDRIKGPMTAVLCRGLPPGRGCTQVARVTVTAGASQATDLLPPGLASGPPRLLAYRVELLNAKGRSGGQSDPVFAGGGAAPPPMGPLTLSARRNAVLVRWTPAAGPGTAVVELRRTQIADTSGPVKPRPSGDAPTAKRSGASPRGPRLAVGEAVLRSAGTPGSVSANDPGGLLDPTAEDADTYSYVAQRVTDVTLAGHLLELRGTPSPGASFTFHDVLPPQPPDALVAVPGEGFGAPLSVDLSWEPNAERDLLGYNVYRRTGQAEFVRINGDPVPAPSYRDMKVDAEHTFTYRVTAVDRRGNESGASGEVHETPRR